MFFVTTAPPAVISVINFRFMKYKQINTHIVPGPEAFAGDDARLSVILF